MLRAQLLVDLELLLCLVLLSGMYIGLTQSVVSIGKFGIERDGLSEQRFNLMTIQAWILCPFSFPHAHRIVVKGLAIVGLQLREAGEALDDFVGLARRTIVGLGEEEIATRIGGAEIGCA